MPPTVILGLLEANTYTPDDDGVEWYVEVIDGWDGADVRLPTQERAFADGLYVDPGWYGGRQLTVPGVAIAADPGGVEAARAKLGQVADLLAEAGTLIVGETVPKQADVHLRDRVTTEEAGPALIFAIPLLAADPLKYATALSSATVGLPSSSGGLTFPAVFPVAFGTSGPGGILVAANTGTRATSPVVSIAGPVTNPRLEHIDQGRTFTVAIDLAAGDTLAVDMRARTVILNGTASRRANVVAGSRWFDLDPGDNQIRFAADSYDPAASMTLEWRSAWI